MAVLEVYVTSVLIAGPEIVGLKDFPAGKLK